jgi:hypothetical protein
VTNKELVQNLKKRRSRLMFMAAERIIKLEAALERIRDCDWPGTTPNRADSMQALAREALE